MNCIMLCCARDFWVMNFIESKNRSQLTFGSLEDLVADDSPVRLIDAFAQENSNRVIGR